MKDKIREIVEKIVNDARDVWDSHLSEEAGIIGYVDYIIELSDNECINYAEPAIQHRDSLVESMKQIESLCDPENDSFCQIWNIAYSSLNHTDTSEESMKWWFSLNHIQVKEIMKKHGFDKNINPEDVLSMWIAETDN